MISTKTPNSLAHLTFAVPLLLVFIFLGPGPGYAHPVSFKGSTGIMFQQAPLLNHFQINRSLTHRVALGVHHFRRPDLNNRHASFFSTNFLLKRWNTKHLQANLYSVLGGGQSELAGPSRASLLTAGQFDIEDRDYYFLIKHARISNDQREDLLQSIVRFGISPYVEDFEGLHSWLIVEWQDWRFFNNKLHTEVTPFVRLFYKNFLIEFGQSSTGMTRFNCITHF